MTLATTPLSNGDSAAVTNGEIDQVKSWEKSMENLAESCAPCGTAEDAIGNDEDISAPAPHPPSLAVPEPSPPSPKVPAQSTVDPGPLRRVPSSDDPDSLLRPVPDVGGVPTTVGENAGKAPPSLTRQGSIIGRLRRKTAEVPTDLWGQPGYLTEEEVSVYMSFVEIVRVRPAEFRKTLFSFGDEEDEPYCYCRWLRARKFVIKDVIKMVEEAAAVQVEPAKHDFHPDGEEALGCPVEFYMTLYPQIYAGNARNGCPVFFSRPGAINIDGVECLTSMERLLHLHWNVMMHDFSARLHEKKDQDPDFKRFECISILDLAGLTPTKINRKVLSIIQDQSRIDSLCFPETMNKMVIVNAPGYFTASWSIIKGFLDPRTRNKIEIISSRKTWEKRLIELIEPSLLPSDYGGTATSTTELLLKQGTGDCLRRFNEVIYVRSSHTSQVDLAVGETIDITIYTSSTSGAKFSVIDAKKQLLIPEVEVIHKIIPNSDLPTNVKIGKISGPGHFKIRAKGTSRFSSSVFFIIGDIKAGG
mmetsp:Transcript_36312/g.71442  ORF Transcript_36312/g.71442 Transcript_36312/m.71442 type:complete len:530 (+) Transcript_36312:254-1843(+)|eukprot:CAMPEP_0194320094 /NCGR_PEP_ID=MMETSP0171-20130528/16474_1 /TAXON_ID=218684 /ORGANISM="Corethron pennatum, Strain L29A3" /LENGTH=529 /DNA_ID=CAMNT_0039077541 /DNA_START=157 /DNA_END=1746 /DNA_ORIENTATION=-